MHLACSCTPDQQRHVNTILLKLFGVEDHLIEGWCDKTAQAHNISVILFHAVDDGLTALHHSHVNHSVIVAAEHYPDYVLAYVVHVTFYGGENNCAVVLGLAIIDLASCCFLCLHEGR